MSKAAFTVSAFSVYLFGLAACLVVAPNLLLTTFGLPPTHEVWIRVLGVVVLIIGSYYWVAAREDAAWFFRWSVFARCFVLLSFVAFVLMGWAAPVLILFGLVDAAGAAWTWLALRGQLRAA